VPINFAMAARRRNRSADAGWSRQSESAGRNPDRQAVPHAR
jgi:hypothetical protein